MSEPTAATPHNTPSMRRHFCQACHMGGLEHVPMVLVEELQRSSGPAGVFECENGHRVEIYLDEVSSRQALI